MFNRRAFLLLLAVLIFLPAFVSADYLGQRVNFFVEPDFDSLSRTQVSATLERTSSHLYFYIEDNWWSSLTPIQRDGVYSAFNNLAFEFDSKIYPLLTSNFGSEWNPGIDNDQKITVLFHSMKTSAKGYFRNIDEYEKFQLPASNQREMVYLNAKNITDSLLKSYLAHEFTHLITFNQKDRLRDVSEDVWLNEGRSEFAISLLGYNNVYEGSYLRSRVMSFLENPLDSLTEWQGQVYDYGILNLFIHYLVDHYGIEILTESLHSEKVGIESINEALKNRGYSQDFSQVFSDWAVSVLINDCSLSEKYCYKNQNLKNVRIVPFNNFLPFSGQSALSLSNTLKDWSVHWQKFSGGRGNLKIEFEGSFSTSFQIPYIVQNFSGDYSFGAFSLDQNQKGELIISNMGTEVSSVTIIPSAQGKSFNFSFSEPSFVYHLTVSTFSPSKPETGPEQEPVEEQEQEKQETVPEQEQTPQFQPKPGSLESKLPFSVSKPLSEMTYRELLITLIKLLLHLRQT